MAVIENNAHVEIIAGRNKGAIGYISDADLGNVEITTGDGDVFNVRRSSLRVLAESCVPNRPRLCFRCREAREARERQQAREAHERQQQNQLHEARRKNTTLNYNRIVDTINRMHSLVERDHISMEQWNEINVVIKRSCKVHTH